MAYLNLAQIIGNLGRDPEYFVTEGRQPFANLSIATTRKWRTQDGQTQEETEWHHVTVFGATATNCQKYLRKGSQVYVSGRLRTRKYTDKQGIERYVTEIIAQDVQFLSGRDNQNGGGQQGYTQQQGYQQPQQDAYGYEDPPF